MDLERKIWSAYLLFFRGYVFLVLVRVPYFAWGPVRCNFLTGHGVWSPTLARHATMTDEQDTTLFYWFRHGINVGLIIFSGSYGVDHVLCGSFVLPFLNAWCQVCLIKHRILSSSFTFCRIQSPKLTIVSVYSARKMKGHKFFGASTLRQGLDNVHDRIIHESDNRESTQ